jgi:hypothetical protein
MLLEFELVFFSSMGYVYLQLEDKIFFKFHMLDVILTNKPSHCQNTTNSNCGLSDVHNIVSTQIKGRIPKINRDYITYRSYKNFDHEKYVEDLEKIDYVNIVWQ